MGCISSTDSVTAVSENKMKAWKEVFPRHAHTGKMTDYQKEQSDQMEEMMKDTPPEAMLITEANLAQQRTEMADMIGFLTQSNKETIEKDTPQVDISDFEIEAEKGVMIKVYMIRPKNLPKENNAAYIYAHGGGAVMFSAEDENNAMAHTALNLQCVVFNVDYRLGPEAKAPKGQCDFAAAIRHISKNAAKYGVDKNQMCMAGISGGGWICFGAGNQLAKTGDAKLVKANFVHTGMLSDETQNIPQDQLKPHEKDNAPFLTSIYKLLATDFEKQKNDTDLYPGKITDEFMKKVPPFAVWTSEFDFYRRDNLKIADRGKACGKLLDVSDMPGVNHGYQMTNYDKQETQWFFQEEKQAFDLWVRNPKK